jgi:hypothetical protein
MTYDLIEHKNGEETIEVLRDIRLPRRHRTRKVDLPGVEVQVLDVEYRVRLVDV